jgi:hypothetical protein
MTSFSQYAAPPRSRRRRRTCAIALVTAGAVLLPAGAALADHMPGMNGTMCPHAAGEGPDSLAAAGPNEPAAPERAPNSAPLAPADQPASTAPAPKPAAPKPVAQAPRPVTQVTKPATQVVTQPAIQAQTQRPATTTAQTRAAAKGTVRAVAATTVAEPSHAAQPRAKRAGLSARTAERSFSRRFNGLEPRVARGSSLPAEHPVAGLRADPASPGSVMFMSLLSVVALIALAAVGVMVRRRHGDDGVVALAEDPRRPAPCHADASMEAELHEMISEARARELLGYGEVDAEAERGESVGAR